MGKTYFIFIFLILALFFSCGNKAVDPTSLLYDKPSNSIDTPDDQARRVQGLAKPHRGTGSIQVVGRRLFVNGKNFIMKGVCYSPTPVGYTPSGDVAYKNYDSFNDDAILARDMAWLRSMHCNTVRIYSQLSSKKLLDACWNNGVDPIYVIMGFWVPQFGANYFDPVFRNNMIAQFREYVKAYKDHPAVLMWSIGNEQTAWYHTTDPSWDPEGYQYWYSLINEMGKAAWEIEGLTYHPVTTPNSGLDFLGQKFNGNALIGADDETLKYLDVWGANLYPGALSFTAAGVFNYLYSNTHKPFWFSEFGADGFASGSGSGGFWGSEDEAAQMNLDKNLWGEIMANQDVCLGGTVFEYCDEWWKNKTANPFIHDVYGWAWSAQPDGYSSEEYYGLLKIISTNGPVNILAPKAGYYFFQNEWSKY